MSAKSKPQKKRPSLKDQCAALEAKCKAYESWLSAISTHAPFELYIKDENSRYLYLNDAFEHTVGKPRDELLNKGPADIFEPGHAGRVLKMDRKVMDEGALKRTIPCDLTGTRRTFEETRFPVFDAEGQPSGLGCFALETTEQSTAEAALNRAQQVARLGNWTWSLKDNCLTACSDTFAELHGVDRDKIFGIMEDVTNNSVHPADRKRYRALGKRLANEPKDYQIEYRLQQPDETVLHVKEIGELSRSSDGQPLEFVGTLQDITPVKQAEIELRTAQSELELRVQERTKELTAEIQHHKDTQRELQIAKLAAESAASEAHAAARAAHAASKAKSEFLAMMSHEIRTPLNGILGMADLLSADEVDEGRAEYIKIIKESGEGLLGVINEILDISRIEAGKLQLDIVEFELLPALESIVEMLAGKARAKGIEMACRMDEALPAMVSGDPVRLRQVLINLMGNAVKFTEEGGIILSVDVIGNPDEFITLKFEVTDTGIGIPLTSSMDCLRNLFRSTARPPASMKVPASA